MSASMTAMAWCTSSSSLLMRSTARRICRRLDLDSTCRARSVLVLPLDETVGLMRRDYTVFALVVSLVPPAAGAAACAALAAACLVSARVFRDGASLSTASRTAALLLRRCLAFLAVDGAGSWMVDGLSTLGAACKGTLGTGCMVASMDRVFMMCSPRGGKSSGG